MCTHLGADRIWTCQTTHYNGYMFENPKTPYSIYIRMIIYIYIVTFLQPPPFPVVTLPGASCKAWGLGRPKPEGRKTMGFCHGMFHRIVMDLYNRFCWCDFFGTSRDFMGYHGIYIYPFCLVCLGVFWGLFMEKHVLEASPTGDWMGSNGCLPSGNLLHGYGIDSV